MLSRIVKRDGRLVPFEPEKISHSLFLATELLGDPNPFLARELTDTVIHFLSRDDENPSADEIVETIVKLTREFGHVELSRIYQQMMRSRERTAPPRPSATVEVDPLGEFLRGSPPPVVVSAFAAGEMLRGYSLERVWPRDLVGAHREGLLQLTGLETPLELAGVVMPASPRMLEAVREVRHRAGQWVAIDGVEAVLGRSESPTPEAWMRETAYALDACGLAGYVNLHCAEVPIRDAILGDGPLFRPLLAALEIPPHREREIVRRVVDAAPPPLTVVWHISERDWSDPEDERLTLHAIRAALAGASIEFCFDRPKRPIVLGPGLDRSTPGCLTAVGIDLERFIRLLGLPLPDEETIHRRLGSLARFARGAGHARQDYLRRHARPCAHEAFLLDRSRLVIHPCGLEAAARLCAGAEAGSPQAVADAAKTLLRQMHHALTMYRFRAMDTVLDAVGDESHDLAIGDPMLTQRQRLRLTGGIHQAAKGGRMTVECADANEGLDLVRAGWNAGVHRLKFG